MRLQMRFTTYPWQVWLREYHIPSNLISKANFLGSVIIHAVGDLMSHPRQLVVFWRVQPIEALIFLAAVFIIIFTNIENGIYVATGCKFYKSCSREGPLTEL